MIWCVDPCHETRKTDYFQEIVFPPFSISAWHPSLAFPCYMFTQTETYTLLPTPCRVPQEVVGQLGPIGGSVDARVSQVAVEMEREKLLQVGVEGVSWNRQG